MMLQLPSVVTLTNRTLLACDGWRTNGMAAAVRTTLWDRMLLCCCGQTVGQSKGALQQQVVAECSLPLSRGKPLARSAGTRQNARNPARLSRKRLGQRQELTRQLATTFAPSAVQRRTSCIGCCTIVYVGALGSTKVRSDQCATVRPLCSAALRRSGISGAKNRATMCSECELSSNERSKPSSASCAAIGYTSPPAAVRLPNAHLPTRAPQHQRTCSIRGPSGESLTR